MFTFQKAREFAERYHAQAMASKEAEKIYRFHGITQATMVRFHLGWMDTPLSPDHEEYVNLPVVPYMSADGWVSMLRSSPFQLDENGLWHMGVIYKSTHWDDDHHLYNVGNAMPGLRTNRVVLATDVLSVLLARQEGMRAVGVPGWANFKTWWAQLFTNADVEIVHAIDDTEQVSRVRDLLNRYASVRTRALGDGVTTLAQEIRGILP